MYAPIIIPTLNRVEHLKRCIESLEKNKLACETELYISVDYPPSAKYEEGYNKIKEYLDYKDSLGFKHVYVTYQQENLGVHKNPLFLINQVKEKYDFFIFTEDDNEFSPNYLEYMNKGKELYDDDDSVIAICGYRNSKKLNCEESNATLVDMLHPWGYGSWIRKFEQAKEWINRENYMEVIKNASICKKLYKKRKRAYHSLVEAILVNPKDPSVVYNNGDELAVIDYTLSMYMYVNKKYALLPSVTKVVNNGFDGSGIHCGENQNDEQLNRNIDTDVNFEFVRGESISRLDNEDYFFEEGYVKYAKQAKVYRRIILMFGRTIAVKIYNGMYIIDRAFR